MAPIHAPSVPQVAQLLVCVTGAGSDPSAADLAVSVEHTPADTPGFAAASGYCTDPGGPLRWTRVCSSGNDAAPATATYSIQAADDVASAPAYLSVQVTTAQPSDAEVPPTADSLIPSSSSAPGMDAAKGHDDDSDQPDEVVLLNEAGDSLHALA